MNPQAVAADPGLNAFVMANAGSGKTSTLVDRVARLLLVGSPPDAVLCLTFTKAAAAEMQRRLYQRLGAWAVATDQALRADLAQLEGRTPDAYEDTGLSGARALFARALETPGGLKVQTIHAFCEQLLRRFPVEAGVSPAFRVIDDVEASVIAAAARERVAGLSMEGALPGLSDAYAAMSESLHHDAFEAMFATFESRRVALAAYVAESGGLGGVPQAVAHAVGLERIEDADVVEIAAVTPPALDPDAWLRAAASLTRGNEKTDRPLGLVLQSIAEAVLAGDAPVADVKAVFFTNQGDGPPRKTLATKAADADTCRWLGEEQARLVTAIARARASRVAVDTVHALTLAEVYARAYRAAKAAAGALDFADLIVGARTLLTDGPGAAWVLYKLDGGVDHLLIDEAQDTSPEQWAIARALTEEFFAGAGARAGGRERTVFVVGDEKQSIFSFQGAAPERLLAESQWYRRRIEAAGRRFETVELLQSWRSTSEVLAFVDEVFQPMEHAQALSPGRGLIGDRADAVIRHVAGRADGPGTIDLWPEERDAPAEDRRAWDEALDAGQTRGARRRVAERIVTEVRAIVTGGEGVHDRRLKGWRAADWGDVLILVKKRGPMFEEVLRALKQSGVPVAGADRLKLAEHPVFEDLLALGRAALYPDDDLTLAGVLRSPLCDVDEQGLFDLAQGRRGSLWSTLKARGDERAAWIEARVLVRWMRREARDRTPFDLFARLFNLRDARGLTVRQRFMTRLGGEAADALDAFLDQARASEGRGVMDLERFCASLAAIDQTVKREMDEPRGEVRVMTAHSAKGLEAPIVILPDAIFSDPKGDALLETEGGGFLWCGSKARDCDASAAARELRKRRGEEESLRLLYVGLTRARDRLIVGGRINARDKLENVKAWWGPVERAFAALHGVREVETASGPARRFGADPRSLPGRAAPAPPQEQTPTWLSVDPPREDAISALAPSRIEGQARAAAPSPLAVAVGPGAPLGRFRRGDVIHRLLERLPDITPAERPDAARRMLARERDVDDDQRAEMIAAAFSVLDDSRFAPVFGEGSRAEVAIVGSADPLLGGAGLSGRIDRLVTTPDRVLVVDYKTNRPAPARIEDADPSYVLQLAAYVAVLKRLYPDRAVEAALVWTDGPRLMAVPEAAMDRALADLKR